MRSRAGGRASAFAIAMAVAAALFAPAGASAETVTVGRTDLSEANGDGKAGACTTKCVATFSARVPTGGNLVTVPADGKVISWGVQGGQAGGGTSEDTWKLRILRPDGNSLAAVGSSPAAGPSEVDGEPIVLANPIPVQAGDRIGVTIKTGTAFEPIDGAYVDAADVSGAIYDRLGALADGTSEALSKTEEGQLLLNAVVELDPKPPAPAADKVAPSVDSLAISPTKFEAANIGPALLSARVGADVFYKLSEAAATSFTVERGKPGFKSGRKCVKAKPNRRAKPCTRYAPVKPPFTHQGVAGLNTFKYSGRVGNKSLKPGRYRLSATATDAAGNRSKPRTAGFKIVD